MAGTGGWFIYDRVIRTDPGVAACEAIRDDEKSVDGEDGDKTMTEHMTGLQSACADQGVIVDLTMGQ
ncbi:hypothetical protein GCM10022629_72060 [Amorphoplanes auranticolor]